MTIFLRDQRSVFKVYGPDAQKLLLDVFTGAMPNNAQEANWWALLSPQGKIQAEGLIGKHQDAYWLDVDRSIAPKFFKRMGMYKLRADAAIEDLTDTHCVGQTMAPIHGDTLFSHKDGRHENLGHRVIAQKSATDDWVKHDGNADTARINLGIPELGADFATDSLFPHDIGMDLLGGIDFSKGCYVGQEVVSRMRHKAKVRRRPVLVAVKQGEAGDEISLNGKTVGTLGRVVNGHGVGIVRLDRISDTTSIMVTGETATLSIPPWGDYDFASNTNPDT